VNLTKGILTYEEWEARIRKKIEEAKGLTKFEELEDLAKYLGNSIRQMFYITY